MQGDDFISVNVTLEQNRHRKNDHIICRDWNLFMISPMGSINNKTGSFTFGCIILFISVSCRHAQFEAGCNCLTVFSIYPCLKSSLCDNRDIQNTVINGGEISIYAEKFKIYHEFTKTNVQLTFWQVISKFKRS